MQRDCASRGQRRELIDDRADGRRESEWHRLRDEPASIGAGQRQQGGDERGQSLQIAIDLVQRGAIRGRGTRPRQGKIDLATQQRERGAQFVRGISGELALSGEGVVDAGQHGIEGARQPAQFIVREIEFQPGAEPARVDARGEFRDGRHRRQGAGGKKVASSGGKQEHQWSRERQHMQQTGQRLIDLVPIETDLEHTNDWSRVIAEHRLDAVVNCVGIWSGSVETFERVQYTVPVALFDACVFYPAQLRDLLLRVALCDAFKARWTDQIHDEWIGSLLRDRPDITAERLSHTRELMNRAVPDCLVTEYQPFIEQLKLPDPDDRHVLAAAIRCQAGVIVTLNVRDFPDEVVARYGISVQHPDEFLAHLFDLKPAVVCSAVREMRASLANPPKTVRELLDDLLKAGLPETVSLLETMENLL